MAPLALFEILQRGESPELAFIDQLPDSGTVVSQDFCFKNVKSSLSVASTRFGNYKVRFEVEYRQSTPTLLADQTLQNYTFANIYDALAGRAQL